MAQYRLRLRASYLDIQLPVDSQLWSATVDGNPAKPRKTNDRVVIGLPASSADQVRELKFVYETPVDAVSMWGEIDLTAPVLSVMNEDKSQRMDIPVIGLDWKLHIPAGYRLARSGGTVFPSKNDSVTQNQISPRPPALFQAATASLYSPRAKSDEVQLAIDSFADSDRSGIAAGYEATQSRNASEAMLFDDSATEDEAADAEKEEPTQAEVPVTPTDPAANEEDFDAAQTIQPEVEGPRANTPALQTPPDATNANRSSTLFAKGFRSLQIDLSGHRRSLEFSSFGEAPRLQVTLVHAWRFELVSIAVAVGVFLFGLFLTTAPLSKRIGYLFFVLFVGSVAPLTLDWYSRSVPVFDYVVFAGLALIPVYAIFGILHAGHQFLARKKILVALLLCCGLPFSSDALAQSEAKLGPLTIRIAPDAEPISIPADAVIRPFNPAAGTDSPQSNRVIIPYRKYEELWNLAYPNEKSNQRPLPTDYAIRAASWTTQLADADTLKLSGQMTIESFSEDSITIPFPVSGGVLTKASLNGDPARISISSTTTSRATKRQQAAAQAVPSDTAVILLHIDKQDVHEFSIDVEYAIRKQGGWRIAEGIAPPAPVSRVTVSVPDGDTEVRLVGLAGLADIGYPSAGNIVSTWSDGGKFRFLWRPKVTQADVDLSLTVNSSCIFDVEEDGVRATWEIELKFPRDEREQFTLNLPDGYVVERISGENIRSWSAEGNDVTVKMLQAVSDRQMLTVRIVKRANLAASGDHEITLNSVHVGGAALHTGRIGIRRSKALGIETASSSGLSRTGFDDVMPNARPQVDSPLGVRLHQAFRFARSDFAHSIVVKPLASVLSARFQTLFRIGIDQQSVESRAVITARDRTVHHLVFRIPSQVEVKRIDAPGDFQWSVMDEGSAKAVRVFLADGQLGEFSVVLQGKRTQSSNVPASIPAISVDQATRQETVVVVQTDPGYTAQASELQNCERTLMNRASGWLGQQQRTLARLAISADAADFSGSITLARKSSRVRCRTISNSRVTRRAFEDTILLDYSIEDAGIRELSFLLPANLQNASIDAPLVRTRTIEPVDDGNRVRVHFELQDEVIGQYRVLIEDDRLLTSEGHSVPIPILETGEATEQFVSLESAGRDEVLVESTMELRALSEQQSQWKALASVLGQGVTQAYVVNRNAESPSLVIRTNDRVAVETVGARIALAETMLMVDESGAFRGTQTYQINNRTEQYLEISLPANAQLWTSEVAHEPVKPFQGAGGNIRIPLVKTAEGESDYEVVLKYGGRIQEIKSFETISFPFIETINIQAEESQVSLHLPESFRWFDFGGSMSEVKSDREFVAQKLKYLQSQRDQIIQTLNESKNPFAKLRAKKSLSGWITKSGESLDSSQQAEQEMVERAIEILGGTRQEMAQQGQEFNRDKLNDWFGNQRNSVAGNQVIELGDNFKSQTKDRQVDLPGDDATSKADSRVIENNYRGGRKGRPGNFRYDVQAQSQSRQTVPKSQTAEAKKEADRESLRLERFSNELQQKPSGITRSTRGERSAGQAIAQQQDSVPYFGRSAQVAEGRSTVTGGAASLLVSMQPRGTIYRFRSPRGRLEITGRAVSSSLRRRSILAAAICIVLLVIFLIYRFIERHGLDRIINRVAAGGLILIGLLLLAMNIAVPIASVIIVLGVIQIVRITATRFAIAK